MKPAVNRMVVTVVIAAVGAAVSGCALIALQPGAAHVKITRNTADVGGCQSVGAVASHGYALADSQRDLKNQSLGLGGNVVFVTTLITDAEGVTDTEGIGYLCK